MRSSHMRAILTISSADDDRLTPFQKVDFPKEVHLMGRKYVIPREEPTKCDNAAYIPCYERAPATDLSYDAYVNLAVNRYRFLQMLEFDEKHGDATYTRLRALSIEWSVPIKRNSLNATEVNDDEKSFFALLLAFVYDEETLKRLASLESLLLFFRMRESSVSPQDLPLEMWKDPNMRMMILSRPSSSGAAYFVDFADAFSVLKPDAMILRGGTAVLTNEQIFHILCDEFATKYVERFGYVTSIEAYKDGLIAFLRAQFAAALAPPHSAMLNLSDLKWVAPKSFPPCMLRNLKGLEAANYLSQKGRLELCLFLKALGLDYFEQYEFWQTFYARSEEDSVFNDRLVPSLKRLYCLEGGSKIYFPHCCVGIIMNDCPESIYQIQGCPFRTMRRSELKAYLRKERRISSTSMIEGLSRECPNHPQIACKMYFDAIYPYNRLHKYEITHPVQFFTESEKRRIG